MKARSDRLFIYDIAKSCDKIQSFLTGVRKEEYETNAMLQDALVRNLEIVGEESKNVSDALREKFTEIDWRDIMRMRDKMAHHYFRVDLDIVWRTVTEDIPKLCSQIKKVSE